MPVNFRPIFLSPHPDDVVLSCGGTIFQLAQDGERPIVMTIFGGDQPPGTPLSDFAHSLQVRWQLGDDAPAARRDEDRAACDQLGAYLIHLSFPDAVYRVTAGNQKHLYDSEEAIFGEVRDPEIIDRVAAALRERLTRIASGGSFARLYVPLTAGHHVDHLITRIASERLDCDLIYYEDYPYAEDAAKAAHVWGRDEWQADVIELSEAALQSKIQAFLQYRSQISTFYRDDDEVAQRMRAYALAVGCGQPTERYWRR